MTVGRLLRVTGRLARSFRASLYGPSPERGAVAGNREFDRELFEELVLFIAWEARDDPRFGRTKMAKTLFYADFDAYAEHGESITGARYEHYPKGPLPPVLYAAERRLVADGKATLHEPEHPGDEAKLTALSEPQVPRAETWQLESARVGVRREGEVPTWRVSDLSHEHPGWVVTQPKQEIPYRTVHISRGGPTREDLEWAEAVAREHGWV